jgi:hypothetical protein
MMGQSTDLRDATSVAVAIATEMMALPVRTTSTMRAVRRKYAHALKHASPDFMLQLASRLLDTDDYRWVAYELIQGHQAAFERLGAAELEVLGYGINSWWTVDIAKRLTMREHGNAAGARPSFFPKGLPSYATTFSSTANRMAYRHRVPPRADPHPLLRGIAVR